MRQLRIGSAVPTRRARGLLAREHGSGQPLTIETLEDARAAARSRSPSGAAVARVPDVVVDNRGKSHVLLLAGEILVGGKQNRVLREDILLPPLSGARPIGVYCVEQGRWNEGRRDFESSSPSRTRSPAPRL